MDVILDEYWWLLFFVIPLAALGIGLHFDISDLKREDELAQLTKREDELAQRIAALKKELEEASEQDDPPLTFRRF